ncbi:amino acid permease/ SLC12A domain-containing protein [Mycena albidolilacea]|uniref:Amino acid permease/ SLC12A domain-containing protein n=1 Tax=Mycena albidolilacea TaxID=1033008 RepID=A0AAD7EF20_9AGAR|nr:amino acid permease/ SLC12A domain-containing protein [Mycena albidolilacea]
MSTHDLSEKNSVELPIPALARVDSDDGGRQRWLGSKENTTVRGMKSRHLTFIAIGGTIGTGLFLSIGDSIATAGPGGALVAYALVGLFVYGVVMTLGEMASLIPVSGAFSAFGDRFVSPVLGATLGWNYYLQWALSIPSELVAASIILSFWTDKLQSWEWSLIIIFPVFAFNLLPVRNYGEAEFWLAGIKVLLIVLFIIVGLIYDWGGVIGHPGPGLSNIRDGAFTGGFAGTAASFTFAFFSFGGVELVALAAGESAQPHKSVPRAIKATFLRIVLFYILTCLVIGLCINHNDDTLVSAYFDSDVAASPITIVFQRAGFGAAVHVVNAVLLTAVLSATNSCFYASSRMLLSLAREGKAPHFFTYVTKGGVPVPALLLTLAFSFLTFLTTVWGEGVVFTWFINLTGVSALFTWIAIASINLRFRRAFAAQGRPLSDLPFRAPFSPFLALTAIVLGCLMFAAQGWASTTYGDTGVDLAKDVLAVYIGVVLFFGIGLGFAIHHKITKPGVPLLVPLLECDFETGAVWGRGGGAALLEKERLEAENEQPAKGGRWVRALKRLYKSV